MLCTVINIIFELKTREGEWKVAYHDGRSGYIFSFSSTIFMSRESKKRTNLMHNECRGVNDRGEKSEEWLGWILI